MSNPLALFDAHCHLTSATFSVERRADLVRKALEAGVQKMVIAATDKASLEGALALQEQFGKDTIKVSAALPPHTIDSEKDEFLFLVKQALHAHSLSAIGETGLEYFYSLETKKFQRMALERYMECSLEYNLPLIIHCRDAFHDLIPLLSEAELSGKNLYGMIHCFTGTLDEARALLDLGWFLSFSGMVTYPKAKQLQDVAQFVPLEKLLIETDAPYLAPKQKRGKENLPEYLVYTAEFLAELRQEPFEEIAHQTFQNARSLFEKTS